jgi:hypothetical protein
MLPMEAAMLPATRLAPALAARLGARTVCAAGLALIVAAQVHDAFADGMHLALRIAAGIVILAAIAVAALLRGNDR